MKSAPELWAELEGERLSEAVGAARLQPTERERELRWRSEHGSGSARLEPTSWGTKVTLTADLWAQVAQAGLFGRFRARKRTPAPTPAELEARLSKLLDDLGQAHRKPFVRND